MDSCTCTRISQTKQASSQTRHANKRDQQRRSKTPPRSPGGGSTVPTWYRHRTCKKQPGRPQAAIPRRVAAGQTAVTPVRRLKQKKRPKVEHGRLPGRLTLNMLWPKQVPPALHCSPVGRHTCTLPWQTRLCTPVSRATASARLSGPVAVRVLGDAESETNWLASQAEQKRAKMKIPSMSRRHPAAAVFRDSVMAQYSIASEPA